MLIIPQYPIKSSKNIVFDREKVLVVKALLVFVPTKTKRAAAKAIKARLTETDDKQFSILIGDLATLARYARQSDRDFIKIFFRLDDKDMAFLAEDLP